MTQTRPKLMGGWVADQQPSGHWQCSGFECRQKKILVRQRKLTFGGRITLRLVSSCARIQLLHYTQIITYYFWSVPALLNWSPAVEWSFPQRWVFSKRDWTQQSRKYEKRQTKINEKLPSANCYRVEVMTEGLHNLRYSIPGCSLVRFDVIKIPILCN